MAMSMNHRSMQKRCDETHPQSKYVKVKTQDLQLSTRVQNLNEEADEFYNAVTTFRENNLNSSMKALDISDGNPCTVYIAADLDRKCLTTCLIQQEAERVLKAKGRQLPREHADSYILIERNDCTQTSPKRRKLSDISNKTHIKEGINIYGIFELCPKYNFEKSVSKANIKDELCKAIEIQIFNGVRFCIEQLKTYRRNIQENSDGTSSKNLDRLILRGKSVLFHEEKQPEKPNYHSATTSIRRRLDLMKKRDDVDIVGFGSNADGFTVYITDENYDEEKKDRISEKIKTIASSRTRTNVAWIPKLKWFAAAGDGLVTQSNFESYLKTGKEYGTLGIFCQDESKRLMAATAGHVVNVGEPVTVITGDGLKTLGKCVIYLGDGGENKADFATVLVEKDIEVNPSVTSKNGDSLQVTLCPKTDLASLENCRVWKRGAKTGFGEGVVTEGDFEFTGDHLPIKRKYILIDDINDIEFADEGDSGSAVFRKIIDSGLEAQCLALIILGNKGGPYVAFPLSSAFEEVKNVKLSIAQL